MNKTRFDFSLLTIFLNKNHDLIYRYAKFLNLELEIGTVLFELYFEYKIWKASKNKIAFKKYNNYKE